MHEQTIFFDDSTSINHYYNQLIGISEWASEEHEFQHIQKAIDKIRVVSVDDLFGEAIRRVHNEESVSSLFG